MSVINEPKLTPIRQRIVEGTIIAAGSTVIGFFLILITLAIWYYAGSYFFRNLTVPSYVQDVTLQMLLRLAIVAIVAFLVMFAWAKYNQIVFGNKHRRAMPARITDEEMAQLYAMDAGQVPFVQEVQMATLDKVEGRLVFCSYEGSCISPVDPQRKA